MVRLFLCHDLCGNFIAPAAETLLIAVEQQLIFLLFRHGYDIILPFHRSHIQYKQQIVLAAGTFSHKAIGAVFCIIRIHPLETVPGIVDLIHCRILAVQFQQFLYIGMYTLIQLLA